MDDLISRAAAKKIVSLMVCAPSVKIQAEHSIDDLPAVDAAPVVHGRWIEYPLCLGYAGTYSEDHIVCSNCKSVWNIIENDTECFDYCPHCGAKMDGERRDDDAAD